MEGGLRGKAVNLLEGDMKYIHVPFADLDELDEDTYLERRQSSFMLSRVVAFGILLTVIGAVIVAILFYTEQLSLDNDDDNLPTPTPVQPTCYEAPSCPATFQSYDPITGFTNMTGWINPQPINNNNNTCCNICPISTNPAPAEAKYDYLVLDQIWLPQFCYALSLGHDPTLSHIAHSQCIANLYTSRPRLTIHGLWPNRYDGSVCACCTWGHKSVPVLDATVVTTWSIYPALSQDWFDPTTNTTIALNTPQTAQDCIDCAVCYLLNHEWQKHGSCYGILDENKNTNLNAYQYFSDGLQLSSLLTIPTHQMNGYNNSIIRTSDLLALYLPLRVNIMCDPQDNSNVNTSIGVFLEVQTCWSPVVKVNNHEHTIRPRPKTNFGNVNFTMIDCPEPVYQSRYSALCPMFTFLRNFELFPSSSSSSSPIMLL